MYPLVRRKILRLYFRGSEYQDLIISSSTVSPYQYMHATGVEYDRISGFIDFKMKHLRTFDVIYDNYVLYL